MRRAALLILLALPTAAEAAPASGPSDPDLTLGRTCLHHPRASRLLAAVPERLDELVVLWPRVGRKQQDGRCLSVARATVVDHQGLLLTVSFVFARGGERPEQGFVPWYGPAPEEGEATTVRDGPARSELVWWPEEARPDVWVVVAGSPSTSEDTLAGLTSFLGVSEAVPALLGAVQAP